MRVLFITILANSVYLTVVLLYSRVPPTNMQLTLTLSEFECEIDISRGSLAK